MSPPLLFDRKVMKASSLDDITVRSDQGIVEVVFKMPLCRPLGFGVWLIELAFFVRVM